MTNEEKIVKALENLQAGQERIEKTQQEQGNAIATMGNVIGQIKTGVEAFAAGQQDMREKMATKADVQDIKATLVKHQRRIENLEEQTSTPNPHKN